MLELTFTNWMFRSNDDLYFLADSRGRVMPWVESHVVYLLCKNMPVGWAYGRPLGSLRNDDGDVNEAR